MTPSKNIRDHIELLQDKLDILMELADPARVTEPDTRDAIQKACIHPHHYLVRQTLTTLRCALCGSEISDHFAQGTGSVIADKLAFLTAGAVKPKCGCGPSDACTVPQDANLLQPCAGCPPADKQSDQGAESAPLTPAEVLDEAKRIITGTRREQYGSVEDSFAVIAELWTAYWKAHIRSYPDSPPPIPPRNERFMVLMKVARHGHKGSSDDLIDCAGYSALAILL